MSPSSDKSMLTFAAFSMSLFLLSAKCRQKILSDRFVGRRFCIGRYIVPTNRSDKICYRPTQKKRRPTDHRFTKSDEWQPIFRLLVIVESQKLQLCCMQFYRCVYLPTGCNIAGRMGAPLRAITGNLSFLSLECSTVRLVVLRTCGRFRNRYWPVRKHCFLKSKPYTAQIYSPGQ